MKNSRITLKRNSKVRESLKEKARRLKKELAALYYAWQNPGVGLLPRIVILTALGYALSPVDLIPDFIPILGYADDLIIIPALIALSVRLIPEPVMEESRRKAAETPPVLSKNWRAGVLIILLWSGIIAVILIKILRNFP
jgi:uncharacterized membrane protein YkvA (DUF1232 family)